MFFTIKTSCSRDPHIICAWYCNWNLPRFRQNVLLNWFGSRWPHGICIFEAGSAQPVLGAHFHWRGFRLTRLLSLPARPTVCRQRRPKLWWIQKLWLLRMEPRVTPLLVRASLLSPALAVGRASKVKGRTQVRSLHRLFARSSLSPSGLPSQEDSHKRQWLSSRPNPPPAQSVSLAESCLCFGLLCRPSAGHGHSGAC